MCFVPFHVAYQFQLVSNGKYESVSHSVSWPCRTEKDRAGALRLLLLAYSRIVLPARSRLISYDMSLPAVYVAGHSGRFPNSSSVSQLWHQLLAGVNVLSQREQAGGQLPPLRQGLLSTGVLHEFDADFFGISSAEAHALDPQSRILLHVVREAFVDAGLRIEDFSREYQCTTTKTKTRLRRTSTESEKAPLRVGVFVGISRSDAEALRLVAGRASDADKNTGSSTPTGAENTNTVTGSGTASQRYFMSGCASSMVANLIKKVHPLVIFLEK